MDNPNFLPTTAVLPISSQVSHQQQPAQTGLATNGNQPIPINQTAGSVPPVYFETAVPPPAYTDVSYPRQSDHTGVSPNVAQTPLVGEILLVNPMSGCGDVCSKIFNSFKTESGVYNNYKNRQSLFLGITQIVIGVMCIAFTSAVIDLAARHGEYAIARDTGYGIWGGISFIITGALGVEAAKKRTRGFILTFLVMCVVSAVLAFAVFVMSVMDATIFGNPHVLPIFQVMDMLIMLSSLVECALTVWGCINCCKVIKCHVSYTIDPQLLIARSMSGNQQIIIVTAPNALSEGTAPNGLSQPVYLSGYLMPGAPLHQPAQTVDQHLDNCDMHSTTDEKRNLVLE